MASQSPWALQGRVATGLGRASAFTALDWVQRQLRSAFGIEPHPGTLNLRLDGDAAACWGRVRGGGGVRLEPEGPGACGAWCVPVTVGGCATAAAVVPQVAGYPANQLEIVAAVCLRRHLTLRDGDTLSVAAAQPPVLRAVVFDVDGTLVNSIHGMWLAVSRAAAPYGIEVPADAVRRSLNFGGSLWEAIIPAGMRGDPGLPATLRAETLRHWPRVLAEAVDVFDGLAATLGRLQAGGLRLAIYTGSRGESFLPLERAGLMGHFAPVVTARDVTHPKPHPEGLLRCLDALGCTAEQAAYVGDSRHDVEAGRAAGMFTVGVLTGAADSALLTEAGAHRLAASHTSLAQTLLAAACG